MACSVPGNSLHGRKRGGDAASAAKCVHKGEAEPLHDGLQRAQELPVHSKGQQAKPVSWKKGRGLGVESKLQNGLQHALELGGCRGTGRANGCRARSWEEWGTGERAMMIGVHMRRVCCLSVQGEVGEATGNCYYVRCVLVFHAAFPPASGAAPAAARCFLVPYDPN